MTGGNFASLTAGLLVRKGEAQPSPMTPSETYPFAQRVAQPPVEPPVPTRPIAQNAQFELPAPPLAPDAPAIPRRMYLQLSAKEYETLGLVAVKKGATPHQLIRKALYRLFVEFVEECSGACHCIRSGCDQTGQGL